MFDPPPPLSPAGVCRREAILRLARAAARSRRRRRRAGRAAGLAVVAVVTAWAALRPHRGELPSTPLVRSPQTIPTPAPARRSLVAASPPRPEIVVTRVETDPDLLRRWKVPPQTPTWQWLTDDELFHALDDAGRPAGLAYIDGRAMLVFRDAKGRPGTPPAW